MGLVIILALALYIVIAIFVVLWAIKHAKKNGKSVKRWGWGAALGMYMLVFWDWIPTVVAHKYYCATEAGFWVYKTPEQWKQENPGVIEILVDNSPQKYPSWPDEDWNGKKVSNINQRIGLLFTSHLSNPLENNELFLNVWRRKSELIDKKTSEVLAKKTDFSAGNGYIGGEPELKFWLHRDSCNDSHKNDNVIKFKKFLNEFRGDAK